MQLVDREGSPNKLELEVVVKSWLNKLAYYGYDLLFVELSDSSMSQGTYYLPDITYPILSAPIHLIRLNEDSIN